ncbi:hypothetical protein BJ742DRAFT_815859 [Cladochytrium replicatum]|nr:hypothetical protein BJ742DRAFT_815859 [Cladochytrium replicatum]
MPPASSSSSLNQLSEDPHNAWLRSLQDLLRLSKTSKRLPSPPPAPPSPPRGRRSASAAPTSRRRKPNKRPEAIIIAGRGRDVESMGFEFGRRKRAQTVSPRVKSEIARAAEVSARSDGVVEDLLYFGETGGTPGSVTEVRHGSMARQRTASTPIPRSKSSKESLNASVIVRPSTPTPNSSGATAASTPRSRASRESLSVARESTPTPTPNNNTSSSSTTPRSKASRESISIARAATPTPTANPSPRSNTSRTSVPLSPRPDTPRISLAPQLSNLRTSTPPTRTPSIHRPLRQRASTDAALSRANVALERTRFRRTSDAPLSAGARAQDRSDEHYFGVGEGLDGWRKVTRRAGSKDRVKSPRSVREVFPELGVPKPPKKDVEEEITSEQGNNEKSTPGALNDSKNSIILNGKVTVEGKEKGNVNMDGNEKMDGVKGAPRITTIHTIAKTDRAKGFASTTVATKNTVKPLPNVPTSRTASPTTTMTTETVSPTRTSAVSRIRTQSPPPQSPTRRALSPTSPSSPTRTITLEYIHQRRASTTGRRGSVTHAPRSSQQVISSYFSILHAAINSPKGSFRFSLRPEDKMSEVLTELHAMGFVAIESTPREIKQNQVRKSASGYETVWVDLRKFRVDMIVRRVERAMMGNEVRDGDVLVVQADVDFVVRMEDLYCASSEIEKRGYGAVAQMPDLVCVWKGGVGKVEGRAVVTAVEVCRRCEHDARGRVVEWCSVHGESGHWLWSCYGDFEN